MRRFRSGLAVLASALLLGACGSKQAAPVANAPAANDAVKITQFYATAPHLAKGEKELLCYGVENGKTVSLSPPRQELSAALSRCVDVNPTATTTYTLTATGASGPPVTQELTVTVGPARVKIIDVTVSSLSVKRGNPVSICFHAQNAAAVEIAPVHFRAANRAEGCTIDNPKQSTTYVISATGADGSKDQEHVTVKVQ